LLLHAERFLDGRSRRRRQAQDLITVETQWIEFKGKDLIRVRNYIRLFVTGNSEWLVPAGYGERRFAIFDMAARKGSCLLRRHRSTRLAVRQQKSKPLFDEMREWLTRERATLSRSLRGPRADRLHAQALD
jgi:hypothetical protein